MLGEWVPLGDTRWDSSLPKSLGVAAAAAGAELHTRVTCSTYVTCKLLSQQALEVSLPPSLSLSLYLSHIAGPLMR